VSECADSRIDQNGRGKSRQGSRLRCAGCESVGEHYQHPQDQQGLPQRHGGQSRCTSNKVSGRHEIEKRGLAPFYFLIAAGQFTIIVSGTLPLESIWVGIRNRPSRLTSYLPFVGR